MVLNRFGRRITITKLCIDGIWRIFQHRLPICIYSGHTFLSPEKFERCVPSDMLMNRTSLYPTLSIDIMSIHMLLSSSNSLYLCLPPPVRTVHFGIEALCCHVAVKTMLSGVYEMLFVGWLPHQPSHAFDDISTPVYDRAMVIVNPSHMFESVLFPLHENLIIWHTRHKLLDVIPRLDVWEMQTSVLFLQHIVIVCLHALVLNLTLDIFVLFTRREWVVGIVL